MKRYWSRLLALVLVVVVGLMGCSSDKVGLSGDYRADTLAVIDVLKAAIEMPQDATNKTQLQAEAQQKIKDFAARYQRNTSLTNLSSFTTMRTALNSLAGHYSSYPNRPVPQKLKQRLEQEFKQVETAVARGN